MPYVLGLIGLAMILYYIVSRKKRKAQLKPYLDSAQLFLANLYEARKDYIDRDIHASLLEQGSSAIFYFKGASRRVKEHPIVKEFFRQYGALKTNVKAWNDEYVSQEMKRRSEFFDNIDGRALDEQQRRSIVTNEKSELVLAGAGCGKTLTITGKVKYLVDIKGVNPSEILLLAFNRKAAEELTERIQKMGIPIDACTFHKLGFDYIKHTSATALEVADEAFMKKIVTEYLKEQIQGDAEAIQKALSFIGLFLIIPKSEEEFENLGKYYEAVQSLDFDTIKGKVNKKEIELQGEMRTLNGETVKSIEEAMIANYLYLHGVEYEYERLYPFPCPDRFVKPYRPDFYLLEYNLYLEHFGIDEDGRIPWRSTIEERKYKDDMRKKRERHKENGTTLLETYSYFKKNGVLYEKLHKILSSHGVKYQQVDYKEIYRKIFLSSEDRGNIDDVIILITTFMQLFKSNGFKSKQDVIAKVEMYKNAFLKDRADMFLDIIKPILDYYEDKLHEMNMIDFNDMINKATEAVSSKRVKPCYKYVIVDEFQDISFGRFKFVESILEATRSTLFCVGDDWQSIYRFTGADVDLCANFSHYFGHSEVLRIEHTYRFSNDLIQVVEPFILANPKQLKKKIYSDKNEKPAVVLMRYATKRKNALEAAIGEIVHKHGDRGEILLLGRNNRDLENALELKEKEKTSGVWHIKRSAQSKEVVISCAMYPNLSIRFSTVHRAKGLEADNVILLNAENSRNGFPNKMTDDPLLQLVLAEPDDHPYAEERRLFYVALTRTKHAVYILTPDDKPSEFIDELVNSPRVSERYPENESTNSQNPACPRCKSGVLVLRNRPNSQEKFLGCSLYPQCDYTSNNVEILENALVCPSCGGYLVVRGKDHKFLGCSNFPLCVHTEPI